jgi:hypothetical protein
MSRRLPYHPFDPERYIGTVCRVGPSSAQVNLPFASHAAARVHHSHRVAGGEVGEFVFIECESAALLGRLIDIRLPERERLSVEAELDQRGEAHPIGFAQLLTLIDLEEAAVRRGIASHPRLGSRVYSAHPALIQWLVGQGSCERNVLAIAALPGDSSTTVNLPPEHVFGRHCAILGATGGGKSWTVGRLVEQVKRLAGKAILIDATGEFAGQAGDVTHVSLGLVPPGGIAEEVAFPYTELSESDLFAILQPSGGVQGPKLKEAIRSLKLAALEPRLAEDGYLPKENRRKQLVFEAQARHAAALVEQRAAFDIMRLTRQIQLECVWPTGRDEGSWGNARNDDYGWCVPLINRAEAIIHSDSLACIFRPGARRSLVEVLREFVFGEARLLRIDMENVPFEHCARELVVNALGRSLLSLARQGVFRESPVVVVLDEAHQFLNKHVGDESNRVRLDAFGLIAKEGRKYGLTTVLATQRPRDIPEDVLSQMGTLIVHRLTNERDREVVERACGEIDRSAAAFLPTLGQGEALVIGVDFPVPLAVQVLPPGAPPESRGPDYGRYWGQNEPPARAGAEEEDELDPLGLLGA